MAGPDIALPATPWASAPVRARLRRRGRAETRLRLLGLGALGLAFAMLATLVLTLLWSGAGAFRQTRVATEVFYDPAILVPGNLARGDYRAILAVAVGEWFPGLSPAGRRRAGAILSAGAPFVLRDRIVADPALLGRRVTLSLPVSDPYDQLRRGLLGRDTPAAFRRLTDDDIARWDRLVASGLVSAPLNPGLLLDPDSRFPELAGLAGALAGSAWLLLTCFLLSFPVGIGAAIYLEEFAPRRRLADVIEININNLAAVPSVVFGLLGLAVFLGWFGLPRSSPFVGGMVLALMTLPTIIIATRAALKAVPPSIREAALGLGASRQQAVFHHVLPLAMPGILTGTILGLAHALGETAPLLLIGMNAFVTGAPGGPFDAATALPTQIFIWADSPERGFEARTSAAILVLLAFLVVMNGLAIFLRNRFERKW